MSKFGPSTKRRLVLLTGFLIAFIVVLNASTFFLYGKAKTYLDNELGERLRAIAGTMAHAVEIESPGAVDPTAINPELFALAHLIKTENLLSNVVILTADGRTVLDAANLVDAGETNPFIDLDYSSVTLAQSGIAAYTRLYKTDDLFMKSAYAPVVGGDGVVYGIVGVEAGASFFDALRDLTNVIVVINAAGIAITVIMGIFLYRQSASLDRAQAAVIQSENLSTMGRMVAGIAHEIRNPLSIIRTSGELLQRKYKNGDEAFSYILEEVDNLNGILTGYLSFAKAEEQVYSPQSLERVVKRCMLVVDDEARSKAIEVTSAFGGGDVSILGDDKRIQQAVLNVLINAVQAVEPRGTITVRVERNGRNGVVTIADNGRGIPSKALKDVTKPFFTTKERGSGLGMSVVSNIVAEHGGKLEIRSVEGEGTVVSIALPLAESART